MKILIIRLSSLGDIILTQPVLSLLQTKYPQAEIYYLTKAQFAEIPLLFPNPPKLIRYEASYAFLRSLKSYHFDLVIDLHGKTASILCSLLTNAPKRTRYNKQRRTRVKIVKGDKQLSIDSTVQLYVSSLDGICDTDWQYPQINYEKQSVIPQRIALFPGATHFTKCYPAENWIELIKLNPHLHFILFGGKDEKRKCYYIAHQTENCNDLSGKLAIPDLVKELSHCAAVLSGDTGPMHIAAAMNIPQIAIFGGTHPRLGFRPLNDRAIVLSSEIACQPCHLHGRKVCPQDHFNCMKSISPSLISDKLNSLLS